MRTPDFFIVGAPKCGTTALYSYLREHPKVFMPERKEPHFYASDFPDYRAVDTRSAYLALFADAPADARLGEASVWYLYSEWAVANILNDNPEARFIVMLRNPLETAQALHWQQLHSLDEDVPDFEAAWALQAERAQGRYLPHHCREPRHLQYRAVCSFAPQVARLHAQVDPVRVLCLLFEDFAADVGAAYARTLDFLGLAHDGRTTFPKINASHVRRSRALAEGTRTLVGWLATAYQPAKQAVNALGLRPGRALTRWNNRPQARPPLSPAFRMELAAAFRDDVTALEELLGRSLDVWRRAWPEPT